MPCHRFCCFASPILFLLIGAALAGAQEPPASAPAEKAEDATRDHARELVKQSKYGEAVKELEALAIADEQLYGSQHPRTLSDRLELAVIRGKAGESIKAEQEIRAQLAVFIRRCGPDQSETLNCRMVLARLLDDLGRSHEAIKEYKVILESRQRMLGPDDLEVARVRHAYGDSLTSMHDYAQALEQFREAEVIFERVLGVEHAETLLNRSNQALAEADHHEFDSAERELKEILEIRERLFGPNEVSVWMTCYHLARTLDSHKRYVEALPYAARAAEGLRSAFAPSNYLVIQADRLCSEIRADQARLQRSNE
jgi:tetratricopeptide (TPR) repeat protein